MYAGVVFFNLCAAHRKTYSILSLFGSYACSRFYNPKYYSTPNALNAASEASA